MPKKTSSWGQQEYIPAGNGDSSGEYADESGSNRHFTNFKKPEEAIDKTEKEENIVEEPKAVSEEENKETKNLKLEESIENRMKQDFASYLDYGFSDETIKNRITKKLLDHEYGYFLRNKEDMAKGYEDYKPLVEEWMNNNRPEKYYYKKGGKWQSTHNKYLAEYIKEKVYTEQEYNEKRLADAAKGLKQSEYDKEITKNFGNDCQVAFGKNYSKEYMEQIVESSKVIARDFPEMKGFIKAIGDRNSLRKFNEARVVTLLNDENYVNNLAKEIMAKEPNLSLDAAISKAKRNIENSALRISNIGGNALAFWQPSQRCLIMLPKTAKDSDGVNQKSYYEMNWHSSDKPMATYYHEFGHAIDSLIATKCQKLLDKYKNDHDKRMGIAKLKAQFADEISNLSKQNYSDEYNSKYLSIVNEKLGTNYQTIHEFNEFYSRAKYTASMEAKEQLERERFKKYNISEYGNTNTQEFIAECFSAYYTGMNNPLATKVVERFLKFNKELGE